MHNVLDACRLAASQTDSQLAWGLACMSGLFTLEVAIVWLFFWLGHKHLASFWTRPWEKERKSQMRREVALFGHGSTKMIMIRQKPPSAASVSTV
eukprot:scaffold34685_cov128-Skeletonema_dohrnii-CCMP3373.AAC.2